MDRNVNQTSRQGGAVLEASTGCTKGTMMDHMLVNYLSVTEHTKFFCFCFFSPKRILFSRNVAQLYHFWLGVIFFKEWLLGSNESRLWKALYKTEAIWSTNLAECIHSQMRLNFFLPAFTLNTMRKHCHSLWYFCWWINRYCHKPHTVRNK